MDARLGYETVRAGHPRSGRQHPGSRLVNDTEWESIPQQLHLTCREGQVVRLLFEGKTREAAARELNIRPRTVRQYIEQIYQKLGIQDRVELALLVVECRDAIRDVNDGTSAE